jgi:hypothetical protein
MVFRGVIQVIEDANAAADGWTRGRRPVIRDDLTVIGHATSAWHAAQRREADMSNDTGQGISLAAPRSAGWSDTPEAEEWRSLLARNRQAAGPQGRTACGTVNDLGYCMSSAHSVACAASMASASNTATFRAPGSAAADEAWAAARAERERMRAMVRSPEQAAAEAERERKASEAQAERERRAALTRSGGSHWVTTGRGPGWLTQAG